MFMNRIWSIAALLVLIQGCQSTPDERPISKEQLEVKTYTYVDLGESKDELWLRARNYLASTYVNSQTINRVSDKDEGVWIGKALTKWKMLDMSFSPYCLSDYQIRFVAKDNKARLQLELLDTTPPLSECQGWSLPSGYGYKQIMEEFDDISLGLESALRGKSSLEDMKDF
jgi:hypothetical protein